MKNIRQTLARDLGTEIDQAELSGFAKSVSEVEWLLLILVAIYLIVPGAEVADRTVAVMAWAAFALVSFVLRFMPIFRRQTRLKIAAQTLFMLAFTTAFMFSIEGRGGYLLSLYLLPVAVSALTLGRWTTLVMVILASTGFLSASLVPMPSSAVNPRAIMELSVHLAPFLLIAMVTSRLAYEMNIARNRIRTLSETDELTGLYNIRAFSRILKREHEQAVRYGRKYAILVIDLNRLKYINDTFGHETGNRAIILVANTIAQQIRSSDAAARYGGDEFVVLLSEADSANAGTVVKRISHNIQRTTIEVADTTVRPSVSIGVASFPNDGEEAEALMIKADQAMYREKTAIKARDAAQPAPETAAC